MVRFFMRSFLFLIAVLLCVDSGWAKRYTVIVCGSGGEEEYITKFNDWTTRLEKVLRHDFQYGDETYVFNPQPTLSDPLSGGPLLESVKHRFESIAKAAAEDDELFMVLIGHGNYLRNQYRFFLSGGDITDEVLKDLLSCLPFKTVTLVNSTANSAGVINTLSQDGRILVTATKSVNELNATEFMEFFIQGLEDGSADQDRDERISILEAARQASALTNAWYTTEGYLATEHALLDDNGDGLGTRLFETEADIEPTAPRRGSRDEVDAEGQDFAIAAGWYIKNYTFDPAVPQEIVNRYLETLSQVDSLKTKKEEIETEIYYNQLESLLIEAAKANKQIKSYTKARPAPSLSAPIPAGESATIEEPEAKAPTLKTPLPNN